ncbi:alpha/beta hydrolase [Piscinibacter sp.]|uniref:alpha/beta hydrolase n=1 Tax=Piscinibacter sp. TaxID=1903157 RepID=UPI002BC3220D|nr:alpha/beta hydrolase [Albitalea sp.]HUG21796.1 alpha/beta hydrolase [Albitalea sp.]
MALDPAVKSVLDDLRAAGLPHPHQLSVPEARQMMRSLKPVGPAPTVVGRVEDRDLPSSAGPLPVRLYWPEALAPHPVIVYFHGGGFVLGDLDTHDGLCRRLCAGAQSLVIAVDYRLAPEQPFPAALDDALTATRWVQAHAVRLHGDATRLFVCGDSAGGNLAAMVCLRSRDVGAPRIRGQLLFYPVTAHYDPPTPSYLEFADHHFLTRESMRWFIDHYLGGASPDGAFPLAVPDLSGLPPAFIVTAECDPLRDEGRAYAERLRAAGVPVAYRELTGMIHSCLSQTDLHPAAAAALQEVCAQFLRSENPRT